MPHTTPSKHPAPKESTLKRIMEFARLRIEGDFEGQSYVLICFLFLAFNLFIL